MTELRYGNLTKELQSQLEVKNIFTEYLAEFSFIEYPNYYESSQEIITIMKAQESAESLLAQLNSKMDQLLAVNARLADSNDKQLRVQRSISQGSLVA